MITSKSDSHCDLKQNSWDGICTTRKTMSKILFKKVPRIITLPIHGISNLPRVVGDRRYLVDVAAAWASSPLSSMNFYKENQ